MNYYPPDSSIHVIARGLVTSGQNIVLVRQKGSSTYFFPGGHVENGESVLSAFTCEIQEELGTSAFTVHNYLGVCEHVFPYKDGTQHEINFMWQVTLDADVHLVSQEDHLEFVSLPLATCKELTILPQALASAALSSLTADEPTPRVPFFISTF